jgi:uncharacterized protein YutD
VPIPLTPLRKNNKNNNTVTTCYIGRLGEYIEQYCVKLSSYCVVRKIENKINY